MKISIFLLYTLLNIILFLLSCNEKKDNIYKKDQEILVKIGEDVISVDEFRLNYEMGFGHLKTGENRKLTYLNYMINEKLLSLEGYRLGFDKSDLVVNSEKALKRELLIETLIKEKVKSKIKVTEEEIREAFYKSKVNFKFRYWSEPNYEKANSVAEAMKDRGYSEVLDEIMLNNMESRIDPKYLETDYINHSQISPELLIAIKDLPYGEISDPIALKGKYFIVQMLDIRRQSITENEYKSKATSIEQVIFYQKFEKALVEYGSGLLEPKSIKTKRKAFNLLAEAIWEWKHIDKNERSAFIELLKQSNNNHKAINDLRKNSDKPFFEYNKGMVSVEEFLLHFNTEKFLKEFKNKKEYLSFLHTRIANHIRDYFLIEEAKANDLLDHPILQKELALWRNKWVYTEIRNDLLKDETIKSEDMKEYFEKFKYNYKTDDNKNPQLSSMYKQVKQNAQQHKYYKIITKEIEFLKSKYKIEIYKSILDTINVIDFKKSCWASMQIFKTGSNRPAFPVTDPIWGIKSSEK